MTFNSMSEMTSQHPNPALNADVPLAWVHATERMRASSLVIAPLRAESARRLT